MKLRPFVLAAGLALPLAQSAAQSPSQTLAATLTVRTKGATTAILGKSPDKKQPDFMFCIDQERSSPQAIELSGPGRVVYQPLPKPSLPAGVTISGPEMIAPTLVLAADDGRAWVFVVKGQKPVVPAGDPILAKAATVNVQGLRRTDWAAQQGPRRGTDIEGCLAPGG